LKPRTDFLPLGRRVDLLLAKMELISEGATGKPLDALRGGEAMIGEWDSPALADDWASLLERLVESMEIELGRARGGRQYRPGNWRVDQKDERIRTIYPHRPARFVAWVEDVPELVVRRLRQEWKDAEAA
jgi:hypothetical protein